MGKNMNLNKKAVALLSGGLDSTLAVRLMIDKDGQSLFEPENFRGPTILAVGLLDEEREKTIGAMIASHSQDVNSDYQIKKTMYPQGNSLLFATQRQTRETWDSLRIG